MTKQRDTALPLGGIDGANPLGFLAALGVLRTLARALATARMSWVQLQGAWRPVVYLEPAMSEAEAVGQICAQLALETNKKALAVADDLTLSPSAFRSYASEAVASAGQKNRSWVDFVAAFACESAVRDEGTLVQDTAFRTMSGAGHQHFLRFMRNIVKATAPEHIEKALFRPWQYDDPVRNLTMRWDPTDDQRYALRWGDPSGDNTRTSSGSMLGANRLAIEGLPLMPSAPVRSTLRTTGFTGSGSRDTQLTWPIWEAPIGVNVLRSLLSMGEIVSEHPSREILSRIGVVEVYRSRRLTISKIRSFSPARPA